jgi:hypothetical protein
VKTAVVDLRRDRLAAAAGCQKLQYKNAMPVPGSFSNFLNRWSTTIDAIIVLPAPGKPEQEEGTLFVGLPKVEVMPMLEKAISSFLPVDSQ